MASLGLLLVFVAVVVMELAALAFVPVTANAAGSSVTAYVTTSGSNTVTPIDLATNMSGNPVPVGDSPDGIAITPNGTTAYVANISSNTVTPIHLVTNTAGSPIPVGREPSAVTITPDGSTAYVTNSGGDTVTPIAVTTDTPGNPIPVGSIPNAIAITPDGKTAYVTNSGSGTVTPITVATNTPGTAIPVGGSGLRSIAITPDGTTAYVTNSTTNTVTPVAIDTNTPGAPIQFPAGSYTSGIAITPNGTTAYVTNVGSATVTPIAMVTNTPGPPISDAGKGGFAIAITPDGKTAYVANDGTSTVTPIDLATNTAGTPIPVGSGTFGIAITSIPQAIPTSTQVAVTAPAAAGTVETLTATITPSTAAGGVQFTDWAMPLGSRVTVADGSVSMTTTLTPGTHRLTAMFVPAGSTAFDPSTSDTLSYTVNFSTMTPSPLLPTPPVFSRFSLKSFPQLIAWLLGQLHLPTF